MTRTDDYFALAYGLVILGYCVCTGAPILFSLIVIGLFAVVYAKLDSVVSGTYYREQITYRRSVLARRTGGRMNH